jgi:hypothetical protein
MPCRKTLQPGYKYAFFEQAGGYYLPTTFSSYKEALKYGKERGFTKLHVYSSTYYGHEWIPLETHWKENCKRKSCNHGGDHA